MPPNGRAWRDERLDRLEQERAVLLRNVRKTHGLQGIETPGFLRAGEQHSQQRHARFREQLLGKGLVTGMLSEVDVELEALALVVMQHLVHQRLKLGLERTHVGVGSQILDGLDTRDGAVAAGLGDERYVVPASLVTASAAQVEHTHGAFVTALRFGQVAARRQDGSVRNLQPLLILISDDDRFHPRIFRHACCLGEHAGFLVPRKTLETVSDDGPSWRYAEARLRWARPRDTQHRAWSAAFGERPYVGRR